jgi:hypothetical protein
MPKDCVLMVVYLVDRSELANADAADAEDAEKKDAGRDEGRGPRRVSRSARPRITPDPLYWMPEGSPPMPSPFPGMNPYFEQPNGWHEFHEALCNVLIDTLAPRVPRQYVVRGNENVYIRELSAEERGLVGRPDVFIASPVQNDVSARVGSGAIAPQPLSYPAVDRIIETSIHLIDRNSKRLVTAIELLSPSNKDASDDRASYLRKRLRYLETGTNLIEIDLLRAGKRVDMVPPVTATDYCIIMGLAADRPRAQSWLISLRDRLPRIPIPLAGTDAAIEIDLQDALHTAYDRRVFEKFIYEENPTPPLSPADAAWAEEILRSHGIPVANEH